ncbi:MAG: helix-turn-helix domain-containing protein [Acidimicrobiia bacterium]|nr:helix-turn-helix domain-containing protein [Acidimicrobiia bacterium]
MAWRRRGDVLRWWRQDVLGLTQQQAAARLNVQPSSLSNWERATRGISIDLDLVDDALKGEGVLAGLLWAYGSPEGLDAGHLWTKVFPGESGPVWVWLRTTTPKVVLEAEWGVARVEASLEMGANGVFLTAGASVPDSPVVIHLSKPGWADFGWGELPVDMPDAPVLPAVEMFEASSASGKFMILWRQNLATKLSSGSDEIVDLAKQIPKSVSSYVAASDGNRSTQPPKKWPPHPEGIDAVERRAFARLRKARDLSLIQLSDRLAKCTDVEVSRDTLRRFEIDVGKPHHPMLPVALDHALGADGRLAVLEIRASKGRGTITFPPYWRGPVWIDLTVPDGGAELVLHRGRWHRELPLDASALVCLHWFDPSVPLRIQADDDVQWRAGVGRRAGAQPVDQNWEPTSYDTAQQALSETEQAILRAADRTADTHLYVERPTHDRTVDDRNDDVEGGEGADDSE